MKQVYDIYHDVKPFNASEGAKDICRFYVEASDEREAIIKAWQFMADNSPFKFHLELYENVRAVARIQKEFPHDYNADELAEMLEKAEQNYQSVQHSDALGMAEEINMAYARCQRIRDALHVRKCAQ